MSFDNKFPFMQTHLDFHTSPDIRGIGSNFSKENFQEALKLGNLDSITVFAKCHHSMCYYPTQVGIMHPHLNFDLTGAMIDAAHEIGVRAPVYITAGWSEIDAINHPEWRAVDENGKYIAWDYDPNADKNQKRLLCSWQWLCLNDGNGYTQHIYDTTEEICKRYKNIDGLFFDICILGNACYCESCKKGMREMGLNPENAADAQKYFVIKHQAFMDKCTKIMKKYHPDGTIFFNSGGADAKKPAFHDYQTHFEMEDLPTAWGGYNKLPLRAKYFRNKGKNYLGMTGKFHLTWGEFGGFKSEEALKFEIATMALYGAGASVGDHMHPDGEMEMQTYENIGYAYRYLEKIAPFCYDGESVADIGVYFSNDNEANEGLSNILMENQTDYDVIFNNNFDKYKLIIIPGGVVLDEDSLALLNKYLSNGGKLILMENALVKNGVFQIDVGLKYESPAEYDVDYIVSNEKIDGLPYAPMLCNIPGHKTSLIDARVAAEVVTPYFSRTYEHFCGHNNTPHNKDAVRYPAIAQKGNIVYLAHSLPKQYYVYGSLYHKRYFMYAIKLVHSETTISIEGMGSQGRCTAIHQSDKSRYCINMVYASPIKRGAAEVIEDIFPIYNIKVSFKTDKDIKKVYFGLTGEEIKYTKNEGKVQFTVPSLECHTSIVLEY